MFKQCPIDEGNLSPLFRAIRDTFTSAQKKYKAKNKEGQKSEGVYMPITATTGHGKTFSCNLLIFTKLYEIASDRYDFLTKAIDVLTAIAESGIEGRHKQALKAIANIESGKVFTNDLPAREDKERLRQAVDLVYNGVIEHLTIKNDVGQEIHKDPLATDIADKYSEFTKSLAAGATDPKEFKKILFITDTRDNVSQSYKELGEMIESLCKNVLEARIIKSMVVLLMSNAEQTKNMGEEIKPIVDAICKSENPVIDKKELKGKYEKFLHYLKISHRDKYQNIEMDRAAEVIYKSIYYGIKSVMGMEKDDEGEDVITQSIQQLIDRLYPASLLVDNRAFAGFMTTDKYLTSITALPDRFTFADEEMRYHVLIIDEVDKQNAVVRKNILKINPSMLVRGVKNISGADFLNFQQNSGDFAGVGETLGAAVTKLRALADEWRTQYSYGMEDGYSGNDRIAELFSSQGGLSSIVTWGGRITRQQVIRDGVKTNRNAYYTVSLQLADDSHPENEQAQKNILSLVVAKDKFDDEGDDDSDADMTNGFPKIINALALAYETFLKQASKAVRIILSNKKNRHKKELEEYKKQKKLGLKTKKVSPEPTLKGCLSDLAEQLGLRPDVQEEIENLLFCKSGKSGAIMENEKNIIDCGFHTKGCSFKTILRISDNVVDFENYNIDHSATGWLIGVIRRGTQVIGISATAKSKSEIHNFSQKTLREELGRRYVEFSDKHNKAIYASYCDKRNYKAHGVTVTCQYLSDLDNSLGCFANDEIMCIKIREAFPPPFRISSDEKDDQSSYLTNVASQIGKIAQAIESFVAHPTNHYMITLSTRNFGKTQNEKDFLNKYVVRRLEEKYRKEIDISYAMDADKMRGGEFDKVRERMGLPENAHKKFIVMSSYASMGAGKNPDYLFYSDVDRERLVFVDDSAFSKFSRDDLEGVKALDTEGLKALGLSTDADTIYMSKPTSMFDAGDDDSDNPLSTTKFKIFCLYNIMCLYEGSVIDARIAKAFIRSVLTEKYKDKTSRRMSAAYRSGPGVKFTFENDEDYVASTQAKVEQAVGRTGRTAWKSKEIFIFADADLATVINQDDRQKHELSHEYFALREEAKAFVKGDFTPVGDIVDPVKKMQRAAKVDNKKTLQHLNDVVPKLLSNYRYDKIKSAEIFEKLAKTLTKTKAPSYQSIRECLCDAQKASNEAGVSENLWERYLLKLEGMENYTSNGELKPVPVNLVITRLKSSLKSEAKSRQEEAGTIANDWEKLRKQVLKQPTIEKSDINIPYVHIYIEVPKDDDGNVVAEYRYSGTPEIKSADLYEFFRVTNNRKMVSEQEAELQIILKNDTVREHFKTQGFCTEWLPDTHIINPAIFTNVYRPALAEQAVEAIVNVQTNLKWKAMDVGLEEKMDGVIEYTYNGKIHKALVDVKYWRDSGYLKEGVLRKLRDAMERSGIQNIIYINLWKTEPGQKIRYRSFNSDDETTYEAADYMEVPGIMDKKTGFPMYIEDIKKFIKR